MKAADDCRSSKAGANFPSRPGKCSSAYKFRHGGVYPVPALQEMIADSDKPKGPEMSAGSGAFPPKFRPPFFQKADWLAFCATAFISLAVYYFSLIPSVNLENSGIFITGAMYPGVPHPPGYPLWTLWGWMFIKLLPIGNIAWRAAFASATASALACGIISLMVSRVGAEILKQIPRQLNSSQEKWLRGICGYAAGMVFGMNSALWSQAVIAAPWSLSISFLCLVLCLLMRWIYEPGRCRFLYAAAYCYGLLLTNSQIHFAFMPAIPFVVAMENLKVGRDMFVTGLILFLLWTVASACGILPSIKEHGPGFVLTFILLGTLAGLAGIILAAKTRRLFTEIKTIALCCACFLAGLSLYLYLPIASMTDPPMNWAYPRTVEGFFHLITCGQYEKMHPTDHMSLIFQQIFWCFDATGREFGLPYLPIAIIPFLFVHRLGRLEWKWIFGLLASFVFLACLMIVVLNPDRTMESANGPWSATAFLSSSDVILAIWFGYGLILLGILPTGRAKSNG